MAATDTLIRIVALCIVLAGAETLHGIARTVWLAPRLGKARAIRWSVVSGTLLALGICSLLVPPLALRGPAEHLGLGLVLAAFMAAFDIVLARRLLRFSWPRIWQDFNPASGNYLSIGLALLVLIPALVGWFGGAL